MQLTDWIQAIASVIALIISTFGIMQTYKIQRTASEPFIDVYVQFVDTVTASKYLSIKNFGNSSATITSLTFSKPLDAGNEVTKLSSIVGTTLAPNQKVMSFFDNSYNDSLEATIIYRDLNARVFEQTFPLNFDINDFHWVKDSYPKDVGDNKESPDGKVIRQATHAILKHLD